MNPVGLILVLAGIFTITGAAMNWDWYMNSRKAKLFVAILGRNGARVFYGILGSIISIIGILMLFGQVK